MTTTLSNNDQASTAEFQPCYPKGYWDDKEEPLQQCFLLHHNEDYPEFLVRSVWKFDQSCRLA